MTGIAATRLSFFLLGATGRTGLPFLSQALARGHSVTIFVRSTSKLPATVASHPRLRAFTGELQVTGERRPENGRPKPLRPFLTPQRDVGTGAIELKARYSYLWARALGDPINGFPTILGSAHEVSFDDR